MLKPKFYVFSKQQSRDQLDFLHENENVLVIICKAWKDQIFLRDSILQRGIAGGPGV